MPYRRRRFLKVAGVAGTVSIAGCLTGDGSDVSGTDWNMGITGEGTIGYVHASGWARVFDEADTDITLSLNTTGGSEEAYRLCAQGENHLARGTSAMGLASANETSRPGADFSGDNAAETVPQQGMGFSDLRPFWVTFDNQMETISDLEGKDIAAGPTGSYFVGAIPFDTVGLIDSVNLETSDFDDVPFALEEERVDACYVYTMGDGTSLPGWAEQMASWEELNILEFTDEQIQMIEEDPMLTTPEAPVSEAFEFDPGVDTVVTPGAPYQWYFHEDIEPDLVHEFMEVTFNNLETLQNHDAALSQFDAQYAYDGLVEGAPVHPGAVEWYEDNDLWDDTHEEG